MPPGPSLAVLVDGTPLPDDQARALWKRFSDWMEAHAGDLAGFAHAEGFASIHPELYAGGPVLVASHTAPQRPYAAAEKPTRGRAKRKRKGS